MSSSESTVQIVLVSTLTEGLRQVIDLPAGATVDQLGDYVPCLSGMRLDNPDWLISINRQQATPGQVLQTNDLVSATPNKQKVA